MPKRKFLDKLVYYKFKHIRETCEDKNLSKKDKLTTIKLQTEVMEDYYKNIILDGQIT